MAYVPAVPKEELTAWGRVCSLQNVAKVVAAKLAHPTATQELLAEMLGLGRVTVTVALATPYARRQLESLQANAVEQIRSKLVDISGNSLVYYDKSVNRGVKELEKTRPSGAVLTNARESANVVVKGVLLPDRVKIEGIPSSAIDYQEQDISELIEAITDNTTTPPEGESPTTPPRKERGDPS